MGTTIYWKITYINRKGELTWDIYYDQEDLKKCLAYKVVELIEIKSGMI